MTNVTQTDIEQYRQKLKQLLTQIPQKSVRSREAILSVMLFDDIDNLRKSGHEWARIAVSFGPEIKWKSLQSSFSREKKKRSKSKKNPGQVAPPPQPPAPAAAAVAPAHPPLPPGLR